MNILTIGHEGSEPRADYETFEQSSPENRRLLRRAELIFDFTEGIAETLDREQVKRSELARRLGKSKGFISQILKGGRNLTLNTIADVADALGYGIRIIFYRRSRSRVAHPPVRDFVSISGGKLLPSGWSAQQPKFETMGAISESQQGAGQEYGAAA